MRYITFIAVICTCFSLSAGKFEDLPEELVVEVMKNCDEPGLMATSYVCRHLSRIARDSIELKKRFNTRYKGLILTISSPEDLEKSLKLYLKYAQFGLQICIDFEATGHMDDLAPLLRNVRKIKCTEKFAPSDAFMKLCASAQDISIINARNLTDKAFDVFKLKTLNSLYLQRPSKLTNWSLIGINFTGRVEIIDGFRLNKNCLRHHDTRNRTLDATHGVVDINQRRYPYLKHLVFDLIS